MSPRLPQQDAADGCLRDVDAIRDGLLRESICAEASDLAHVGVGQSGVGVALAARDGSRRVRLAAHPFGAGLPAVPPLPHLLRSTVAVASGALWQT